MEIEKESTRFRCNNKKCENLGVLIKNGPFCHACGKQMKEIPVIEVYPDGFPVSRKYNDNLIWSATHDNVAPATFTYDTSLFNNGIGGGTTTSAYSTVTTSPTKSIETMTFSEVSSEIDEFNMKK